MHRLPPELLTRIFDLSVHPDSKEYTKQLVALTHVCQYWRSAILSYPRMWSTIHMKPGNPALISECLARSQKASLTILAEFIDPYDHPPCRYQDSATMALDDANRLEVCVRHGAVLSLDQLLPHCSRILDLNIVFHSSDPAWDDHEADPILLFHEFFKESLPNLRRLDFSAFHVEQDRYAIPAPSSLFAGYFPCLKELKYLGMFDGPMGTVKNLTSCEIGFWPRAAGPTLISNQDLQVLLSNNGTLESLTIRPCHFLSGGTDGLTAIPMANLRYLNVDYPTSNVLPIVLHFIHAPQFKDLDTVHISFESFHMVVRATDCSGHVLEYSRSDIDNSHYHPLQSLGTHITTLRLGVGATFRDLQGAMALSGFLRTLDTVQVLELDGMIANCAHEILSQPGMLPELKVIRVTIGGANYESGLRFLAAVSGSRMKEGNPLTVIELYAGGGAGKSYIKDFVRSGRDVVVRRLYRVSWLDKRRFSTGSLSVLTHPCTRPFVWK